MSDEEWAQLFILMSKVVHSNEWATWHEKADHVKYQADRHDAVSEFWEFTSWFGDGA